MFGKRNGLYSLSKARHIMKGVYNSYKSQSRSLTPNELKEIESHLQALDQALLAGDREKASAEAHAVEDFSKLHFKKSLWSYLAEMGTAIIIALLVATIVRQMWFEIYEIPTGSMRPTFEEQDHLTVTKTAFGINVPLQTAHFYFDPNLVQRTSVVIWSGDKVPHLDSNSKFMGIFPYTKRFIKRCMGKPGDTVYFYGGKIYAFDKDGNDLPELRDSAWMDKLDHVPFTHFEGRRSHGDDGLTRTPNQVIFHLFNQSIGRFRFMRGAILGEIFNGKEWVKDQPESQKTPHDTIQTYSDFWGIRNFAVGRLLNKQQLDEFGPKGLELQEGILYLELRHTPSLTAAQALLSERYDVGISGYTTVIPLEEKHLKALMANMYTCRFQVKDGRGTQYRLEERGTRDSYLSSIPFSNIPNGVYEFYYGKAYGIGWGGIATLLEESHPLYSSQPVNIQRLFNGGIEMSPIVEPISNDQFYYPNRYIYFRDGALYAMGGLLMEKDDPLLVAFHEQEKKREEKASLKSPYVAFKDYGPPLTSEGKIDREFIKTFGYRIPEGQYLVLGDNHAMSQDSRWFGPVPQANLQGAPSLIIWPPGPRLGVPLQKPYPLITFPRLVVWGIAALSILIFWLIHQWRKKQPIFKKH